MGGCHTYGFGLPENTSFVQFIVDRLQEDNFPVTVDYYAPLTLRRTLALLRQGKADDYDLIILQLGHYELLSPARFHSLLREKGKFMAQSAKATTDPTDLTQLRKQRLVVPPPEKQGLRDWLRPLAKLAILRFTNMLGEVDRIRHVQSLLKAILWQLAGHQHKVILLTPLPHLEPVSRYLRRQGRSIFLEECAESGFPVLDTHTVIPPVSDYFIPGDQGHLNHRGHQLLGEGIYNFYQQTSELPTLAGSWVNAS